MASLNKVFLIGNLTRDPDLRHTPGGSAICEIGMAVNRRFFTATKEERKEVCFVDVEVWGRQAESVSRFTRKGAPVFIEGRLRLDQWDDRETGRKRNKLRVVAERVQFLERGERGGQYGDDPEGGAESGAERLPAGHVPAGTGQPPDPPDPKDDFPADADDEAVDNIPF